MRSESYILTLDEGTTSAKSSVIDGEGNAVGEAQNPFQQYFPRPGWVEHDPEEIWEMQLKSCREAVEDARISVDSIEALGVTNQRETTVLWDKKTGEPVHRAIVWQDRRTSEIVDEVKEGYHDLIGKKTGLIPDSYFSAPKIKWLIDNDERLKKKVESGEVLFGTIDSYLIFKLTGGEVHATDLSNASRTMLFDIEGLGWDPELLEIFDVPRDVLPEVKESADMYGRTKNELFGQDIPICGCIGDQQAALFGQCCMGRDMVKNTYGTGSFILQNTGDEICRAEDLLTTISWGLDGGVEYALEGSVFIAGAGVEWLRDSMGMIDELDEAERLAISVDDEEEIYFVPAFVGLGAPYWDQYARGTIVGMTRGTDKRHLAKAALEAMGYLSEDVLVEMEKESGMEIEEIRADGGAAENDFLMQFQADISDKRVIRPEDLQTTSLGAAYMAGLEVGLWEDKEELACLNEVDEIFEPKMKEEKRSKLYRGWKRAVERASGWARRVDKDV
ncbi:MAG: glycerol kinase GlpK [Candidatus Aenigmatarchaeota archaeon]